MLADASLRK